MASSEEALDGDSAARIEQIRTEVLNAAAFLKSLGDGGWNHPPPIIAAVDGAHTELQKAAENLADAV